MPSITRRDALMGVAVGSTSAVLASAPAWAQQAAQRAPSAPNSGTMQRADNDMRKVLEKLQQLGAKPLGSLSVEQARKNPTPADAVKAVLRDEGKDPQQVMAALKVGSQNLTYPTGGGTQAARVYKPEGARGTLPVIVYYHGGGWVIADLDTYEATPMSLAHLANAVVVSVEYRHAPESKFPLAHEDAFNAWKWALQNAAQWGGDPRRVAVAGESAGGNLAANVAIMARDQKVQLPAHMLLVYPVAGVNMNTPSYQRNVEAIPLDKQVMIWFVRNVIRSDEALQSPMLDLVGKANLRGLPSATVITAGIDPLMSEGRALADKLRQAGSHVTYANYEGVTHEFFGMAPVVKAADQAQQLAARELHGAFTTAVSGGNRAKR